MEINRHPYLNSQRPSVSTFTFFVLLLIVSFNANAYLNNEENSTNENQKLKKNIVEYYQKDNITNQIPYFDNRFRLDASLEEITLIFYRKRGSTPIILIRPDGSKIRVNNFEPGRIQWFDDSTFDMIKIKNPMPGPWQAVGDILPHSQILIVSDVKIAVEPLPAIVFTGETLKVEGKLFNGEDAVESRNFKYVVDLDVNFYSTNNSLYENFGANAIKVTSFRDDGRNLDEYANDNVFTGEFILNFAAGEWQPVYLVKLPMETRELRQSPILLHKTPITISVVTSSTLEKPHEVTLSIDPSFVDPDSLIFQGKFTFPDKQIEPFSIMEESGTSRTVMITNTESGLYRVNVSAFGKTITGREFRLVVPEFSFSVEPRQEIISSNDGINTDTATLSTETAEQLRLKAEKEQAEVLLAQQQIQAEEEQETLILIVAGNSVIVIIGLVCFFILRRKKVSVKEK